MWLMEKSSNDRANWVYHHNDSMDPERYKRFRDEIYPFSDKNYETYIDYMVDVGLLGR